MTNQKLTELYLKMMEEINRYYPKGLFQYLNTYHKEKAEELQVLEDKINEAWDKCLSGEMTPICYLSALKAYRGYMGDMMRLYQKEGKE